MRRSAMVLILVCAFASVLTAPTGAQQPATPSAGPAWIDLGSELQFRYTFVETEFAIYLLGEARTTGDVAVTAPEILVTLIEADGIIAGSTRPIALYPIVEPGVATPYQVVVDTVTSLDAWDHEQVDLLVGGTPGASCTAHLRVHEVTESEGPTGIRTISGLVKNDGTEPRGGIIVWAAFVGDDGMFAGAVSGNDQAVIPPGGSMRFSITALGVPGFPFESPGETYRVFAVSIMMGTVDC